MTEGERERERQRERKRLRERERGQTGGEEVSVQRDKENWLNQYRYRLQDIKDKYEFQIIR